MADTEKKDNHSDDEKQRLAAELKELRHLYQELNAIFEDSRDGFFVTNGEGYVIRVNKAYEEMSGVKREDLLGRNMTELEGLYLDKSATLMVMKTGKEATIEQEYLKTKRTAYITSTPIFDDEGNIIIIVSNNRDFQEIDKLKRQLEETKVLADQWEKKIKAITTPYMDRNALCVADPEMYEVLYTANKVAKTDSIVLIVGETGTGKEEVAKYIHQNSTRSENSFLTINCGAIAEELIESELFGYEKGAFTGASPTGKLGFFEVADQGTLFLDEIGEMPLRLQAKLLRSIQSGEILRVGSTRPIKVDVRIIAATNRDLLVMTQRKEFREDLYYRLNVVQIQVPPLRDRKKDILALADFFLKKFNERHRTAKQFGQHALAMLQDYEWPGNVRELRNFIESLVIVSENNIISPDDIIMYRPQILKNKEIGKFRLKDMLEQTEYEYIEKYYGYYGTLQKTAEKLGMNIKTLSRRRHYLKNKYDAK